MLPCTLHVGTMKTGTSAIQEALFHTHHPPGFQYTGMGRANSSLGIQLLIDDPSCRVIGPLDFGAEEAGLHRVRAITWQRLERAMRRARSRKWHLVLSAEVLFGFQEDSLHQLRQLLNNQGFEVRILGYLRPYHSYLESLFQTLVLLGKRTLRFESARERDAIDYQPNVERFWRVFGRDRTTWVKFDPASFPGRCVVQDFCQRVGMLAPSRPLPRLNESLSLPAVQLLYSYNRGSSHGIDEDRQAPPRYWLFQSRLRSLPGPAFRLHSSVIDDHLKRLAPQIKWIESELGFSLAEDSSARDHAPCIRSEEEMRIYDPTTLDWLARETYQSPPPTSGGERTVDWVVEQMEKLRERRPSWSEIRTHLWQRGGEWYNRVRFAK